MQRKTINLLTQPVNQSNNKSFSHLQSPNKTFIQRKNLNLNSFKKAPTQKSSEQKQGYLEFKYTLPNKVDATQRSLIRSQNSSGQLFLKGHFQDISANISRAKNQSKQLKNDKESKGEQKANSTKPFDEIFSGLSQRKSRDKSDDYYLYWKAKAHEYLQVNMKMMEDIRKLTRENDQLKQRISSHEEKALSNLNKEAKSSQLIKQSLRKQQNKSNGYLIQKLEELQRELKKKEIVVKSYEEKLIQLNSRIVGDNQRAKLINKLKSQIDSLKTQLNGESSTKVSCLPSLESRESSFEEKQRSQRGRGYFKGSTFERQ